MIKQNENEQNVDSRTNHKSKINGPIEFKSDNKKGVWQAIKKGLFFTKSGVMKGLFYISGFWILFYLFNNIRAQISDILNRKPPSYTRLSRRELLAKYNITEEDAYAWASRLRTSQIMMIIMSFIALLLGWVGGSDQSGIINIGISVLTILFVMIFFILVLRDQWRIEILENEIEWQPITVWLRIKFLPKTKK